MTFKINLGDKSGKTYKLEAEATALIDKKLGDTIKGEDIAENLNGFEFEITGASDKAGFPALKQIEGFNRTKALLTYGPGMHKKPRKEGKFKISNPTPKGLRLRKTVRGNIISEAISQINLKVSKEGTQTLEQIYAPKEEVPAAE